MAIVSIIVNHENESTQGLHINTITNERGEGLKLPRLQLQLGHDTCHFLTLEQAERLSHALATWAQDERIAVEEAREALETPEEPLTDEEVAEREAEAEHEDRLASEDLNAGIGEDRGVSRGPQG